MLQSSIGRRNLQQQRSTHDAAWYTYSVCPGSLCIHGVLCCMLCFVIDVVWLCASAALHSRERFLIGVVVCAHFNVIDNEFLLRYFVIPKKMSTHTIHNFTLENR